MRDLEQILALARRRAGQRAALATIVRTHGSSYRAIGTRMLVTEARESAGALSAGCLEEDIRERGARAIASRTASLVPYDTRRLFGCDGRIDVLIEPVQTDGEWSRYIEHCFESRTRGVLLTLFENVAASDLGTTPILANDHYGETAKRELHDMFAPHAANALRAAHCVTVTNDDVSALLHVIQPPVHLVVAGGAYDAAPLARLARSLGWRVTVLARPEDDRSSFAEAEILPVTAPDEWPLVADERMAAVVMTHHFGRDAAFLRQMLQLPFGYIGLLGPRERRERLLDAIDTGFQSGWRLPNRLHSPAGLDVGAETPEEIALAIISEIQAVMNRAPAGFLSQRKGPIHHRATALSVTATAKAG